MPPPDPPPDPAADAAPDPGGEAGHGRAWGWVEHLRGGGTTRWREWSAEAAPHDGPLPGAQRLEVLRRLNELGVVPELLADAVLTTVSLGRGQQDRALIGAGPAGRFGAPRVTPADLPTDELRRVATGALADLSLRATVPAAPARHRPRWRRPRYLLAGDPLLVASYDAQLRAQRRPPGGRDPAVLVLVAPLDVALADAWARRVLEGGRIRWGPWLERWAGPGLLPETADAAAVVARWAARRGRDRVHVVTAAGGVGGLTGGGVTAPRRMSHAALEAVRTTSTMLNLAVAEERHRAVLAGAVVPWLRAADRTGLAAGSAVLPGPAVPPALRPWLDRQADRVRESLATAGYPVVGDAGLDAVLPRQETGSTDSTDSTDSTGSTDGQAGAGPGGADVLAVLLTALHRAARDVRTGETAEGGTS